MILLCCSILSQILEILVHAIMGDLFYYFVLRQGFTKYHWLAWNEPYFIHSSAEEYLDCYQCLTIMKRVAMNLFEQVYLQ